MIADQQVALRTAGNQSPNSGANRRAAARATPLRLEPGPCSGCGADLTDAPQVGVERRQVFDLPPMTVQVTERQVIARRCQCGVTTCGTARTGVTAPVQYRPRISAIILYLNVGQFLSKKRTAQALVELFNTPVRGHRGDDD